jgi:hypothetical protein
VTGRFWCDVPSEAFGTDRLRLHRWSRALSSGSRGLRGPRDRRLRCRIRPHPRMARVAGGGLFPAPSLASAVAGWPSRSSARSARSRSPPTERPPAPSLPSRVFLVRPGRLFAGLLSWDSSCSRRSGSPMPLHRHHLPESTPTGLAAGFGVEGATLSACSALVVSHHLGGLLLWKARGLVASRCRSWGSPRFRRLCLGSRASWNASPSQKVAFPATFVRTPRRMFPDRSRTASPRPLPP